MPLAAPGISAPVKTPRKKKEPFTPMEDEKLRQLVEAKGPHAWHEVAEEFPGRNPRQCRERWALYLSPEVCNAPWSQEDEIKLLNCYEQIGAKWTVIAKIFPNRTANNVKNKLKQLLRRMQKYIRDTSKRRPDTQDQQHMVLPGQSIMKVPETQEHLTIPVTTVPCTSDQIAISPVQLSGQ